MDQLAAVLASLAAQRQTEVEEVHSIVQQAPLGTFLPAEVVVERALDEQTPSETLLQQVAEVEKTAGDHSLLQARGAAEQIVQRHCQLPAPAE